MSSTGSTTTTTQTTGACRPTQRRSPTASPESGGREFILTLWTDDPALAAAADDAGVQRIGVDLERLGKRERQRGRGTWISPHTAEALGALRGALPSAQLFARTEPLHPGSAAEIETLLGGGVEVLMLPMFTSAEQVERFSALVAGRARVVPLLETRAAAEAIEEIVCVPGLEEIHLGVNDLALSLGVATRFEVLLSPLVEHVAERVCAHGLRLGVGAVGRARDRALPVPSDLIYARLVGLGAEAALIARSFAATADAGRLAREVARCRRRLSWWQRAAPAERADARRELAAALMRCTAW